LAKKREIRKEKNTTRDFRKAWWVQQEQACSIYTGMIQLKYVLV